MPSLIHHLTHPGCFTASAVVCGDATAAVATWDVQRVTCPQCQRQCTCGPTLSPCPACQAWQRTHRADGSRRPPPLLPTIRSERALQEAIRQACAQGQWLYYHTQTSLHSAPGFPDVCAVRGPQLLFAELKMPGKRPTAVQQQWLDALGQVTQITTRLWYPTDMDAIEEVLR